MIGRRRWIEQFQQRTAQMFLRNYLTAIQDRAEDWLGFIEFAPHAQVLSPLAGEEQGNPWSRLRRAPLHHADHPFPLRHRRQFGLQISRTLGHNRQPLIEMAATRDRSITKIAQIHHGLVLQIRPIAPRQIPQRPPTLRRQRQQV